MFEVCKDKQKGYCRILRCMSDVVEKHKETELQTMVTSLDPEAISHQSTWVLIFN
jgi:hypothetical protein